ncbi:hypothetical protein PR001_g29982 [Phytophthora rubi]|uniref:Uncharacterized protein n=1 Tax=Phytophthora rubi TaxID=129364 RepID=A0A6A3GY15_9STRA|nr:hypothetical protein PR001_g29982 [Phytophthora rubi]
MRACVVRGVIGFARMRRFVSVRNGAGVRAGVRAVAVSMGEM